MPKNKDEKVAFKELESKAIDCVVKTIEELKGLKSVVVENILHNLATSK